MRRLVLLTIVLAAAALPAPARATPVLPPGLERRVENLFADVGAGETAGWRTGDIEIRPDRIRADLQRADGARLIVELCHPAGDRRAVARTSSFEWFVVGAHGLEPAAAAAAAAAIARGAAPRDRGGFWATPGETRDTAARFAPWSTVWSVGFALLLLVPLAVGVRRRAWREPEARAAAVELAVLFVAALVVRARLVDAGTGNLRAHLPGPDLAGDDATVFGPGHAAWLRFWFALLGPDDSTAFLAGAVAGALTVVPVYLLGWFAAGRRAIGLAGGVALAVFPLHARLSPTDDPASLLGLLSAASLALVTAADRVTSGALLACAWVAAALAAATRPEPVLAFPALLALVATLSAARRAQFRPAVAAASALVVGGGIASALRHGAGAVHLLGGGVVDWASGVLAVVCGPHSVLAPPRTSGGISLLILVGLVAASRATRARALLWWLAALSPALPTAAIAGAHFVTARYQAALFPVGAVFAGYGAVWIGERIIAWQPRARRWLAPAAIVAAAGLGLLMLLRPPAEPTFRLEYGFFSANLSVVPRGCRVVQLRWDRDRGLEVPVHLSRLRGLRHDWVAPSPTLDPDRGCLAYWLPAACSTLPEGADDAGWRALRTDCDAVASSFRLVPLAETRLPARPGFVERYADDEVLVGFYRLESRR